MSINNSLSLPDLNMFNSNNTDNDKTVTNNIDNNTSVSKNLETKRIKIKKTNINSINESDNQQQLSSSLSNFSNVETNLNTTNLDSTIKPNLPKNVLEKMAINLNLNLNKNTPSLLNDILKSIPIRPVLLNKDAKNLEKEPTKIDKEPKDLNKEPKDTINPEKEIIEINDTDETENKNSKKRKLEDVNVSNQIDYIDLDFESFLKNNNNEFYISCVNLFIAYQDMFFVIKEYLINTFTTVIDENSINKLVNNFDNSFNDVDFYKTIRKEHLPYINVNTISFYGVILKHLFKLHTTLMTIHGQKLYDITYMSLLDTHLYKLYNLFELFNSFIFTHMLINNSNKQIITVFINCFEKIKGTLLTMHYFKYQKSTIICENLYNNFKSKSLKIIELININKIRMNDILSSFIIKNNLNNNKI